MLTVISLVIYDSISTISFGISGVLPDFYEDSVIASRNCEVLYLMYFPVEEVILIIITLINNHYSSST